MNDAKNYLDGLYFFCDYCVKYKPQVPGACFRNKPVYYQLGRKMKEVTMCLDCSKAPEYTSTLQDAWCRPVTEISGAYEGILKVIREETTISAAALVDNSTILTPAIAAIRFEDAVIKAC